MSESKRKVTNKLVFENKYKLTEWVKSNKETIIDRKVDKEQVAKDATEALEFKVEPANLTDVGKVLDLQWPRKNFNPPEPPMYSPPRI